MTRFSVLDLSPVPEGSTVRDALHNSRDLARLVERLGFSRFWLAEHHNNTGIASAATSVAIGYVAEATTHIRVGAGGVMLPNHAPLVIAEQFGTLAALYPGRVDLGIGRAPGTDQVTARALRRTLAGDIDDFPKDVIELMNYFRPAAPGQQVQAVPGAGLDVPVWILGSSLYGAQLAAALGLPYAFASHFAPDQMMQAIDIYRSEFRPSQYSAKSRVMLGLNVVAADTHDDAIFQQSSRQQGFVALRQGRPGPLPPPVHDYEATLSPLEKGMLARSLACSVVGDPAETKRGIEAFVAETGADEVMITTHIYDHAARRRSFEIVADVMGLQAQTPEVDAA